MADSLRSRADGIAWPALPDAAGSAMLALQWQLERTERLPAEALRAQQIRQVAALTAHAARMPFWQERFAAAGIRPGSPPGDADWHRLPILTRPEVQAAGPALFARSLPPGHGAVRRLATSGSTGHPVTVRSTGLAHFFWRAFLLRLAFWHELDFSGVMVSIGRDLPTAASHPDGLPLPDWGAPFSPLFATGPAAGLDDRLPLADQVAWLCRRSPSYLHSRPANIEDLARFCLDHGIRVPTLRAVRSFADRVTPELRDLCRQAWDCEILSAYSAEEVGYIALQCPLRPHYHVQSEGVLLELLRDDGSPCAPGETGRVVITPLHNFAMPLLRYALGDYAEAGPACPCGRGLPVLTRIVGRSRRRLRLPDGTRRFPDNPSEVFATVPAIRRYQIAQVAADQIEVRLVATAPLSADDEARLTDALAHSLGHRFAVRFVRVAGLATGPGGKFEDVVYELTET